MAIVNRYHPRYCPADQHICIQNVCLSGCMIDYVPEQPKPAIDTAALDRAVRHTHAEHCRHIGLSIQNSFRQTGFGPLRDLDQGILPQSFVDDILTRYRTEIASRHSAKIGTHRTPETPGGSSWMST